MNHDYSRFALGRGHVLGLQKFGNSFLKSLIPDLLGIRVVSRFKSCANIFSAWAVLINEAIPRMIRHNELFALRLFESVGQAMNGLLPKEKHIKTKLHGNIIGMIFIFALWPIVLPIWVFTEMRSNVELTGLRRSYGEGPVERRVGGRVPRRPAAHTGSVLTEWTLRFQRSLGSPIPRRT